ncbi:hypothetical protein IOQ59_20720 [Pontibacterium sp. N1Y112]|uniref:Uncharacterized protein n=1 Tax=Pontibacterium sinense TaxID=2781979 RepID=A0A8J7K790_9GAMM|nr:hypothetical protein [Pontibacterium sinense]MBE9399695.1 hypothetical protein [Pontibacterium sinense]
MALFHSLMRYKDNGLIQWFDMFEDDRAEIHLSNGDSYVVFMNSQYIVGESVVDEANDEDNPADYIIYNTWDQVASSAKRHAENCDISMVSFGRFSRILEELND